MTVHPYENYDLREDDPYLIPGSECLENNLGITDTKTLTSLERQITAPMLIALQKAPIQETYDLKHLCGIHKRLFGRVYPFAGKVRAVEIAKGGRLFLPHAIISVVSAKLFLELRNENYLLRYDKEKFCQRIGYYFASINTIHPFREGNGRTQRILIDQLAAKNGYKINWAAISGFSIAEASAAALAGDKAAKLVKNNLKNL